MPHPFVRLQPRMGRRLREGTPWAFSNEIVMDAPTKALPPGSLVNLQGDDGARFGTAIFNPHSLISARLVSSNENEVLSADFFASRLGEAARLRDAAIGVPHYRLIHAEGDFLPGLVIDRYGDLFVCQIGARGMMDAVDALTMALQKTLGARTIVIKGDRLTAERESIDLAEPLIVGAVPAHPRLTENDLAFAFDPVGGQKTGWFFDQRANRAIAARFARGSRALDLFCHTGGFGLTAIAGGASEAVCVDASERALALVKESAEVQGVAARVTTRKADVLETLSDLGADRFGVVVCDPPAFAKTRKDIEPAARAYQKLARECARLVEPGGVLALASCSHHMDPLRFAELNREGIRKAGRKARLIATRGADMDHPVHPALPETAYLKFNLYVLS